MVDVERRHTVDWDSCCDIQVVCLWVLTIVLVAAALGAIILFAAPVFVGTSTLDGA
jgi:hypothetical protein